MAKTARIPASDVQVILVDPGDRVVGRCGKIEAHRTARLHRAVSTLVFNSRGELLIQQRASSKYHSPDLWSNTSCTHPLPGESSEAAGARCLAREMGVHCRLSPYFHFLYKGQVGPDLFEWEYDHVFVGVCDDQPDPDPSEAQAFRWVDLPTLRSELRTRGPEFTLWFRALASAVSFPQAPDLTAATRLIRSVSIPELDEAKFLPV